MWSVFANAVITVLWAKFVRSDNWRSWYVSLEQSESFVCLQLLLQPHNKTLFTPNKLLCLQQKSDCPKLRGSVWGCVATLVMVRPPVAGKWHTTPRLPPLSIFGPPVILKIIYRDVLLCYLLNVTEIQIQFLIHAIMLLCCIYPWHARTIMKQITVILKFDFVVNFSVKLFFNISKATKTFICSARFYFVM